MSGQRSHHTLAVRPGMVVRPIVRIEGRKDPRDNAPVIVRNIDAVIWENPAKKPGDEGWVDALSGPSFVSNYEGEHGELLVVAGADVDLEREVCAQIAERYVAGLELHRIQARTAHAIAALIRGRGQNIHDAIRKARAEWERSG